MIRYYITDRKAAGGVDPLLRTIDRAVSLGVDWIQIREKDLDDRELLRLTEKVVARVRPAGVLVFVNSRMDVAILANADGIHLPAGSMPANTLRPLAKRPFRIGVSCHSIEDLRCAERDSADYALFSPVFESNSKPGYGPILGTEGLAAGCRSVSIPVLALGGLRFEDEAACRAAGAAGIAGISLFQNR